MCSVFPSPDLRFGNTNYSPACTDLLINYYCSLYHRDIILEAPALVHSLPHRIISCLWNMTQNGRRGKCAKYIQLIQSYLCTQYSSITYRHDFLPIPTGSALCTYIFGAISSSSILHPILLFTSYLILWSPC